MLETLLLSLLMSNNWPLDIAMTGICASDEVLNSPSPRARRIRALGLFLYREAQIPFRVLGGATRWLKLPVPTRTTCRFEPLSERKTSVIRGIIDDGSSSTTVQA